MLTDEAVVDGKESKRFYKINKTINNNNKNKKKITMTNCKRLKVMYSC